MGTVVAVLLEEDESADDVTPTSDSPASSAVAEPVEATPSTPTPAPVAVDRPSKGAQAGPMRISPVARRLAEAHGVDVNTLVGTGPSGRIVKRDVLPPVPVRRRGLRSRQLPSLHSDP